jgi:streptomycin 6-kinase
VPELDEKLRARLRRRYGAGIDAWFAALPALLADLGKRWELAWGPVIQRGSMSVVIRCRTADGDRPAVLKVCPDRARLAREAAVLASWETAHAPDVLAVDESAGALLLEAIEPGTPLAELPTVPSAIELADLMSSLHDAGVPDRSYRPVTDHIVHLFDSGTKPYELKPELLELVPRELYERGRRLALRLAADQPRTVVLHGDLTPVNVLDGGPARGLVAIDPAPCLGDPAFEAVDFVLWRAKDIDVIAARAEALAPAIGADPRRLLDWCTAFAGMIAVELAELPGASRAEVEPFIALAARA